MGSGVPPPPCPCPYLLKQVSLLDSLQYTLLRGVLDISTHQELIQDEVGLLKVEDDVQLTYLGDTDKAELKRDITRKAMPRLCPRDPGGSFS